MDRPSGAGAGKPTPKHASGWGVGVDGEATWFDALRWTEETKNRQVHTYHRHLGRRHYKHIVGLVRRIVQEKWYTSTDAVREAVQGLIWQMGLGGAGRLLLLDVHWVEVVSEAETGAEARRAREADPLRRQAQEDMLHHYRPGNSDGPHGRVQWAELQQAAAEWLSSGRPSRARDDEVRQEAARRKRQRRQ